MLLDLDPGLLGRLQDEVGDALRTVAVYDEDTYEIAYLRDDIGAAYSNDEIEQVYEEFVLQGLTREFLEGLFHAGDLQCSIYGFEDAAMFHFTVGEYAGLFVSIDRLPAIDLETIISLCKDAAQTSA